MTSINRSQVSGFIGNIVYFIQDHLFSSRHPLLVKVAALALARVGYLIVQEGVHKYFTSEAHKEREYKWSAKSISKEEEVSDTSTSSEEDEEEKVTDLFFRITGRNIPADCPVYLLGADHNRSFNQYPKNIIHSLKDCQVLVSSLPISQKSREYIRTFVIDNLTLTLNKLRQGDEAWFHSQFMLLGCSWDHLAEQMELVRKAQAATDLTLESWQPDLAFETIEIIQKHLKNYKLDPLKTHPLLVMSLLDNELDLLKQNGDEIETHLIDHWHMYRREDSWIELQEIPIMSANLTHMFMVWLTDFRNQPGDANQVIQMFCKRLEIAYSNDEKPENEHLQQPGLYSDRFIEVLSNDEKTENEHLQQTGLYEDRWIVARSKDPSHPGPVTLQSTIAAKNLAWRAQILEALKQNKSTAIVMPRDNLDLEETGMLNFLRSQGYTVELA